MSTTEYYKLQLTPVDGEGIADPLRMPALHVRVAAIDSWYVGRADENDQPAAPITFIYLRGGQKLEVPGDHDEALQSAWSGWGT